jgi:hypothetical protein
MGQQPLRRDHLQTEHPALPRVDQSFGVGMMDLAASDHVEAGVA